MADIRADRINWYRTPIDKETLKRLTRRSDARAFAQVVPQLALTVATGAFAYWAWDHLPLVVALAAFYLHGTVYAFVGVMGPGHELCHGTPFKTRLWNEFFLWIFSFLSWTNYVHFRASHTQHHLLTVHSGRDLEVVQPLIPRRRDYLFAFTCNPMAAKSTFLTTVRHAVNRLEGEWERRIFPDSEPARRRAMVRWARVLLVGHTALAAAFLATGKWRLLFLVTLAPFYGGWLSHLCWMTQHAGLIGNVPDFRLICRTALVDPITRFLYWNMTYHVEHHMYAGVPFYNLPALRKAIEPDLPVADKGLFRCCRQIVRILRKQKEDPAYAFEPPLPATAHAPVRAWPPLPAATSS